MGELATNRNSAQYYGGVIYCSFSSDEGRLKFCESLKEIWFVLKLQGDNLVVLCSLFENPVTINK